jgi:chromosome segregation ATPase
MSELFVTEVDEIKALEQQAKQLTLNRDEQAAEAEKLNAKVFALRTRRDELEKVISNGSKLILNKQLSIEAYDESKKELSALYQHIDLTDETFNMFDRAINEDYPKQLAELQNKINGKRSILLNKFSSKIAGIEATIGHNPRKPYGN